MTDGTRFGFYADGSPLAGDDLYALARKTAGNTVLLSFSGKDSLCCWLELKERGFDIIPYYLDWIPGLSWVDDSIAYYEDYFEQHIMRLPHPSFWRYLNSFFFQPPERVARIRALGSRNYDFYEVDDLICRIHGLPEPWPFCAIGMRSADSLARMRMIQQMGAISREGNRRYWYPIWDWKIVDVVTCIKRHGVKLPIDYKYWGNTSTTFLYRYMRQIKSHFPADWERVLAWFPLIELELFRYEVVNETAKKRIKAREARTGRTPEATETA